MILEDEGDKFLQNIRNYSPHDTVSYHRRPESIVYVV
jgi:hypothetical protein